jgi:hypothetical protein
VTADSAGDLDNAKPKARRPRKAGGGGREQRAYSPVRDDRRAVPRAVEEVARHRPHSREKAEALLVASRVRAESEREAKELKAEYEREAESATAESKRQADEIVRGAEAEAEAEKMLEDARLKVRGFEQEIRDAEQLAVEAPARIAAFLESLLAELDPDGTGLGSPVDELVTRIGEATKADPGEIPDQPKAPHDGSRQPSRRPRTGEAHEDGGD